MKLHTVKGTEKTCYRKQNKEIQWLTTTLSSLRTTTCDALIVPSEYVNDGCIKVTRNFIDLSRWIIVVKFSCFQNLILMGYRTISFTSTPSIDIWCVTSRGPLPWLFKNTNSEMTKTLPVSFIQKNNIFILIMKII